MAEVREGAHGAVASWVAKSWRQGPPPGACWLARWSRLLAAFGGLGAVTALGVAAWAPAAALEQPFWLELLGLARLQAAEPGVLHRSALRAGSAQVALACLLLSAAALWLARAPAARDAAGRSSSPLESPLAVALLVYIALWFHVALPQLPDPATSPLLVEQNFDSHSYVHQAAAWLRGDLHIDRVLHDTIAVGDRRYTIFPPFPALLLLPLVAAFGSATKTLLLTPVLGALTALASMRALTRLEVPGAVAAWCTAGLVLGSPLLLVSGNATDSYFAHCCAMSCAMAAFCELTGRCRPWLVGLLLGAAVLSRQLTILMLPFFLAAVALPGALRAPAGPQARAVPATSLVRALALLGPLALCITTYALHNWARSGDWLDTGYNSLVERGWYKYRANTYGDFDWAYVPSNLLRLLVLGLGIDFESGSYMVPRFTGFGSSLTFTSPFLYFALKDLAPRSRLLPGPRLLRPVAWLSIAATVLAVLLHKSALGGYQIHGQRYTLDFTPLLFPIAALAIARAWPHPQGLLARWLIGYSIAAALLILHVMPALISVLRGLPH
ncbi:MAG TPA: hypothetical protein VNN80_32685 [Polyangiaceae bacterium]|nr:hypothetical protein [Polyangiaceae bacterium]